MGQGKGSATARFGGGGGDVCAIKAATGQSLTSEADRALTTELPARQAECWAEETKKVPLFSCWL